MSKSSWGAGAWAAEAEREEAEEKEMAAAAPFSAVPMEAFPTLGEAVSMGTKKKKKQTQTFSLAELTTGKSVAPGSRSRSMSDSVGLTTEEMMMLPTGPSDRSGEEDQRGLGGAFRDYRDYNRGDRERGSGFERDREGSGFFRDRERDEPSRADDSSDWISSKKQTFASGFDSDRRGSRFSDRGPPAPSRADDAGNWGSVKKSLPVSAADTRGSGRREYFAEDNKQQYRADDADNWTSSKKPSTLPLARSSGQDVHSRADDADKWSSIKKSFPTEIKHETQVQEMGADSEGRWGKRTDLQQLDGTGQPQRRRLVMAPRTVQSSPPRQSGSGIQSEDASNGAPAQTTKMKSNPFGNARPREDVLSERGHDVPGVKIESGERPPDNRPSSTHSTRLDTSEVIEEPIALQDKPKVNSFGDAKLQEILSQETGKEDEKQTSTMSTDT